MNLTNGEKLWLAMILDRAETETRQERENYLRSADLSAKLEHVSALTDKLKFIERLQLYCTQMEGAAQ